MVHDSSQEILEQNYTLQQRLQEAREELRALIQSGHWLVWKAHVLEGDDGYSTNWNFRSDYAAGAFRWLPIATSDTEDFGVAITNARLPEDNAHCDANCHAAMYGGKDGYQHEFRVRLVDGEIHWLSETVHIQKLVPSGWYLTGIAIDVTEKKRTEEELAAIREEVLAQNSELQNIQAELEAQNSELQSVKAELERQNDELAMANALLENLATTDGLTGLKNHRAFQDTLVLEWRMSDRGTEPLSLIFLDIDDFKQYNDSFGHPAGDDVLKKVAELLTSAARKRDYVARYGGEEFVVIAPQTDEEGACALAERFRQVIATEPFLHRRITSSFGVSTNHGPITDVQTLIHQADTALYAAKERGRNRVEHAHHISTPS